MTPSTKMKKMMMNGWRIAGVDPIDSYTLSHGLKSLGSYTPTGNIKGADQAPLRCVRHG